MSNRPKFRIYIANEDDEFDFKEEAGSLWERTSRAGNTYWSGVINGQRAQMWVATFKEDAELDAFPGDSVRGSILPDNDTSSDPSDCPPF